MRPQVVVTALVALSVPIAITLAASACGDNHATAPDSGVPDGRTGDAPADACPVLQLGTARLQLNAFGQLTGLRYPVLDPALPDTLLLVELYDSTTPGLPALTTGAFDLAGAPETDLATCQHCVYLGTPASDGTVRTRFFQTAGSLTLTTVEDPLAPVFAGAVTAELHEVTVDDQSHVTPVPGGACRRVTGLAFDTTPTAASCTTLTDCPNELLQVCDPTGQQCVAPQCDLDAGGCTATQACVPQLPNGFAGACYEQCDPAVPAACGPGFLCRQGGPQPHQGLCLRTGARAEGEACEVEDASTSCGPGLACSAESRTCTAACNLFLPDPGCAADRRCSLYGRCEPPSAGDAAGFGATCGASAGLASACAANAVGFQGYCFAFRDADPLVCVEACLGDGDCTAADYCAPRFTSGLGTCLPDPVCGDGILGEIGEVCDDGNVANADACSSDCQTVGYGFACALATPIAAGMTVSGTTTTGLDGFQASCQGGRARTDLYRFSPATPGRLTLTTTAAAVSSVSVLASCGAVPDELACAQQSPTDARPIVVQLVTAAAVDIGVGAFNSLEQGAYTLRADFVPERCGDGIVAGREVCDDGNQASGDGCNGTCTAIEYDVVCAMAAPLSLVMPNTGTTVSAPYLFENNCSAPVTGRDRVYTFTAPAAGTLTLSLDQGAADLGLAVFRGCGAPATLTELACSSVLGPNEEATVPLAAGERVTVVVDGFGAADAGPYSLAATFQ